MAKYDSSFSGEHTDNYDERLTIIEEWKNNFLNMVYPVGSIYMSVNNVSPSTLFGGTWAPIYSRMLIGAGGLNEGNTHNSFGTTAAGTLQFAAGEMGGELQHTLTTTEMPSHYHVGLFWYTPDSNAWNVTLDGGTAAYRLTCAGQGGSTTAGAGLGSERGFVTGQTGSSSPHNNMPPYLGVYMWKRTA